ncbi:phage holin family protein [Yoonia vestfoldensis]|uniref:phage holin family protein n=1 Tax=Yoonia vestfoldensis TaxID=245188 RepID=UPI0003723B3A|nr:phage holin family protein [Yoonia vestfoldensis]
MTGLVSDLRRRARLAARAAALSAAGIVFCATGLAFLTVALWVLLATHQGVLAAWTVLGLLYMVLGICFVLIAGRNDRKTPAEPVAAAPQPAQGVEPFLRMAEGFAAGMQAGRNARRPRR